MTKKIISIILIFISATIIWIILGSVNFFRTKNIADSLSKKVNTLWGNNLSEREPEFYMAGEKTETYTEKNDNNRSSTITKKIEALDPVYPLKSEINSIINLEYRKKGLNWFSTYNINYKAKYFIKSEKNDIKKIKFIYYFPSSDAVFDDFKLKINNKEISVLNFSTKKENEYDYSQGKTSITNEIPVHGDDIIPIEISYLSKGIKFWKYTFGKNVSQIKDFTLEIKTNFDKIDFPDDCISADIKQKEKNGYYLKWRYDNLLSGKNIGIQLPVKINPGEMATKISFFAPISLLFFFAFLFFISSIKDKKIHPMHYFFLACAFFSFHLFFSYTIDHFNIFLSFGLASIISLYLIGFYINLIHGWEFTLYYVSIPQFIYLVVFTFSFFFEGFTGLTVTIASIITLFVLMKLTAKINWENVFKK